MIIICGCSNLEKETLAALQASEYTFIEKEWISEVVQIIEIQRQFVIFEMGHLRFSLPALTDWQEVTP